MNTDYKAVWKNISKDVSQFVKTKENVKLANSWHKFKLLLLLSISVISYIAALNLKHSPLHFLLLFLSGVTLVMFVINSAHDASHNILFRSRRSNELTCMFAFFFLGIDGMLWKLRHIHSHHQDTNIHDHDPDIIENSFLRLSPTNKKRWIFRFQQFYAPFIYTIVLSHTFVIKDFLHVLERDLDYTKKIKNPTLTWIRVISVKLLYVLLVIGVPYLFFNISISHALICLAVMHLSASSFFAFTVSLNHFVEESEFYHEKPNITWFEHHLKTSNDWHPENRAIGFLLGGVNTHLAHHLFPNISHRHYPKVSKIIYKHCDENNITIHTNTFWKGVRSHYRFLKKMGTA